jgi:hypothetical protein
MVAKHKQTTDATTAGRLAPGEQTGQAPKPPRRLIRYDHADETMACVGLDAQLQAVQYGEPSR